MVYSLHLLCSQSQATNIPGREHWFLIPTSLSVLPQPPCQPERLTMNLGTQTSVKPSNGIPHSCDEMQSPSRSLGVGLPCLDLEILPDRSQEKPGSFRPQASVLTLPVNGPLPLPLLLVPESKGRPVCPVCHSSPTSNVAHGTRRCSTVIRS